MQSLRRYLVFPSVIIVIALYVLGLTLWVNRDGSPGEKFDSSYIPSAAQDEADAPEKETEIIININTATEEDFCKLEGIGPVLARRIIEKRQELGGFTGIYQITGIEGIGQKTYDDIKDCLVIE